MRCTSISCKAGCGYMRNPTANNRESRKPLACSQNRICLSSLSQSSFAVLLIPSSGPFGQILSPPQRLPGIISPSVSFWDCQKRTIYSLRNAEWISPSKEPLGRRQDLPERSRWRDEPSCLSRANLWFAKDTTSESEEKQIRFASPEGRIRADSRLVFSHAYAPSRTRNRRTSNKNVSFFIRNYTA